MYVVGSEDENELILDTVLDGVTGALSILLGGDVSANNILEHLDVAMLTVDETVDDVPQMERGDEGLGERWGAAWIAVGAR